MIPALAFVPLQNLEAAFQELSDNSPPELQLVLDCLEDNYIGRPNRRRRCPPVFPVFHEQLVAGHAPPRKLRRYQLCDQRIELIVQNYANYGMMDYLRGLAHNFEMN